MKIQHSKNSLYGVLSAVFLANLALAIASGPLLAADPSFDCNKAQRPDEFAICTSNRLSALDELASFGYISIRNSVGRQQANEANMPFIKDRIECLNNANCIQRTQILAIRTFQRMGAPISEYQIQRALLERIDTRTTAVDVAEAKRREEQENQKRAEEESRKRAADWQAAQQAQEEQRRLAKVEETRLAALKQEVETQRLELARIAADKAKVAADAAKANEERARIASEQIRKEQQKAEDESRERMALIKEQEDKRKLQLAQLETDRLKAEAEIAKARLESERMAAQESERQRQIAEAQYKNSWGYWFSSWFGSDEKVKVVDEKQKLTANASVTPPAVPAAPAPPVPAAPVPAAPAPPVPAAPAPPAAAAPQAAPAPMTSSAQQNETLPSCVGTESTWHNCIGSYDASSAKDPNTIFIGEFRNGLRNGVGVTKYADGDMVVAMFKEDKRNGSSAYYKPDGRVAFVDEFQAGQKIRELSNREALPIPSFIKVQSMAPTSNMRANGPGPLNNRTPPEEFCDKGVFLVNGQPVQFDDIMLDGNRSTDYNKKGSIEAYAYLHSIIVADDPYGTSGAKMYQGDVCHIIGPKRRIEPNFRSFVEVTFNPQTSDISQDKYREIRRTLLKARQFGDFNALVKISGSFGLFSNTYELYFAATNIEIIGAK